MVSRDLTPVFFNNKSVVIHIIKHDIGYQYKVVTHNNVEFTDWIMVDNAKNKEEVIAIAKQTYKEIVKKRLSKWTF